jgi:quercetin dioxygenase-like cupin family protein
MQNARKPSLVQPGTGKELHAFGNVLTVMLTGDLTGGVISIMTETTPPGGGPPLHRHTREDEIFLVIEGRISYL